VNRALSLDVIPPGFLWGAATASYQIEGGVSEDGRGPSIWDTFTHTAGRILNGDTGDVSCDHYHRWRGDLALMRDLGLQAYRFSVAWPRVFPEGTGRVNTAGLDWYDRLVDGLLDAGITPFVTLYHWDLPQPLQDRGGWASREAIEAFVAYADAVVRRLGDRVRHWITHNEPWVVTMAGHVTGRHAPGLRDLRTALMVGHHLLVSHGRTAQMLRSSGRHARIGIALNLAPIHPARDVEEDREAAMRCDGFANRWFLDPLFGRGYPSDIWTLYGANVPEVHTGDLDDIAAPLDFLGVNHYGPSYVRRSRGPEGNPLGYVRIAAEEYVGLGFEVTEMGWPVSAPDFDALLRWLSQTYGPKAIYVTENGAAMPDKLVDGAVHDVRRVDYLASYTRAMARAIADGVPVQGYFVWSLLDNFEWDLGFSKRFGLVYVDYPTQRRILKDSAHWYSRLIAGERAS
jgi:beta-glucosidase